MMAISEVSLPRSGSAEGYRSVRRRRKGSLGVILGAGKLFTWVWEQIQG